MSSTSFDGQFEDSPEGFKKGDRARITAGEHAGKWGVIDDELLSGYYVVTPEGETRPAILETFELQPVVVPQLVAGLPVPPEDPTKDELGDWVAETVIRLSGRVSGLGPMAWDHNAPTAQADGLEWIINDLDEVVVTAIELQMKLRRSLFLLKGGE